MVNGVYLLASSNKPEKNLPCTFQVQVVVKEVLLKQNNLLLQGKI